MLFYNLLGHVGVILAAVWITAAGARLVLGDRRSIAAAPGLSMARLVALFRHLYRQDFPILMILLVTTGGVIGKYGGWLPPMEGQFFFESVNVLAVLYAVVVYHIDDL